MRIRSNLQGTRGFAFAYKRAVRFRDMISKQALHRAKVLAFFEKHGEEATKDAFSVSRATLFRWQKALKEGSGKLEKLNPRSTAPKRRRKRVYPEGYLDQVITLRREHHRLGKKKLAASP